MINITDQDILCEYLERGIRDIVSVPCSITDTWHSLAADASRHGDVRLTMSNHEGNLAGIAAGIFFGSGRPALIHIQNTGMLNLGDGFVTFANPRVYSIPMAILITLRGMTPDDTSEPHQEIGRRTDALIHAIFGADTSVFGCSGGTNPLTSVARSVATASNGGVGIFKLATDSFQKTGLPVLRPRPAPLSANILSVLESVKGTSSLTEPLRRRAPMERDEAIRIISQHHPNAAILYCNGFTSRAAQAVADRPGNFYNVGYMGGTMAVGWGLAKSRPDLDVVVVDGDQNAQMSAMSNHLLSDYPSNLHWYILNNHIGASVGTSESLALSPAYSALGRVVDTIPDEPGSFRYPRVSPTGAYFDGPPPVGVRRTLADHARGFRMWIAQQHQRQGDYYVQSSNPNIRSYASV